MNDAIIIKGKTYAVHRINYIPGCSPSPCDRCDLRRKCEAEDVQPCRLFNKGRRLAYFRQIQSKDAKP